MSAVFIIARDKTYVGGDSRSSLQARSIKNILKPLQKIALGFDATIRAFFVETIVDRLQSSQGCDWIGTECAVIKCLRRVSCQPC